MSNIPKVIHYCWFGRGKKSKLINKCIRSWKKYLPDYEIIEWNEDNFDITLNRYVKEAYAAKKYAFVSDYARLYILYNYGGVYLDTDIEIVKPIDCFLKNDAFAGFEKGTYIAAGIMGCKARNKLFKEFLDYYEDKYFIKEDKTLNTTTIVNIITTICNRYGLKKKDEIQMINGFRIYPKTYFYPLNYNDADTDFSENTYVVHHYLASWHSSKERRKVNKHNRYMRKKKFLIKFMSERHAYIVLDFKWIIKNKLKKYCALLKSNAN